MLKLAAHSALAGLNDARAVLTLGARLAAKTGDIANTVASTRGHERWADKTGEQSFQEPCAECAAVVCAAAPPSPLGFSGFKGPPGTGSYRTTFLMLLTTATLPRAVALAIALYAA